MRLNICNEDSLSNILLNFTLIINIVLWKLSVMDTSVAYTGFNIEFM